MIPEEWSYKPLGEEAYIKARIGWRGLSASEYTHDGPYLIAGQHIKGSRIDWDNCDHISAFRYEESSEIILQNGDIIISKDGTIGRVGFVENMPGPATINGTMMLIRGGQKFIPRFLYYYFQSSAFSRLVKEKVSGSSVPHIFQRDIVNLLVVIPPKNEQRHIADILASVDAAIEATQLVIEQTKKVKQGLLQTLLTRGIGHTRFKPSPLGEIPESWEVKTFDDVCDKITDGTHFSPPTTSEGYLYITSKNIRPLRMDLSNPVYVSEEEHRKIYPRCDVKKGDVLLTKDGANTGNAALNILEEEFSMLSSVALIRANPKHTSSAFICQFLNSPLGFEQSVGSMSGQAITRITLKKIRDFILPVPPITEQKQIMDILVSTDQAIDNETAKLASLQQLKKGLMQDLLTGKVRVKAAVPALKLVADKKQPRKTANDFQLISPVEPIYIGALHRAEIVSQLGDAGAKKTEKVVSLSARHCGLEEKIDRTEPRHAAGPYDGVSRHIIDDIFKQQKWFTVSSNGENVTYKRSTNYGGHKQDYQTYLGDYATSIQGVIDLLKDETPKFCEGVATLYAAWNDLLLDGKRLTDAEIFAEFWAWHADKKKNFSKADLENAIAWMRRKSLVPTGKGRKTKALAS